MPRKPTYEELELRVRELDKQADEHKHIERALWESEHKYHSLFDESLDAIYITSREGKLVDANPAFLELFDSRYGFH